MSNELLGTSIYIYINCMQYHTYVCMWWCTKPIRKIRPYSPSRHIPRKHMHNGINLRRHTTMTIQNEINTLRLKLNLNLDSYFHRRQIILFPSLVSLYLYISAEQTNILIMGIYGNLNCIRIYLGSDAEQIGIGLDVGFSSSYCSYTKIGIWIYIYTSSIHNLWIHKFWHII